MDQFESNSNIFSYADWLKDVKVFSSDINFSDYEKNIFIEESSKDFRYPNSLETLRDSPLENVLIGRHTYKLPNGMTSPNVVIGRYCSISAYVLLGLTHHNYNLLSTSPSLSFNNSEPLNYTVIGCDVWIGANAIILNGAKIGHGSVIGAGAVVKKNVPPYSIVVGNKAEVIKTRFCDEIINDLLELKWWTLPHETICQLPTSDIKACIAKLKEIRKIV